MLPAIVVHFFTASDTPASVFFLMVSATCHFPLHPERGSHVPYQSLC
jgi:hypothetical protein